MIPVELKVWFASLRGRSGFSGDNSLKYFNHVLRGFFTERTSPVTEKRIPAGFVTMFAIREKLVGDISGEYKYINS